jgi:hypothetical protein
MIRFKLVRNDSELFLDNEVLVVEDWNLDGSVEVIRIEKEDIKKLKDLLVLSAVRET